MIKFDLSTLIDRPVEDVFSFVADLNNMPKWNSAVVSIQPLHGDSIGAGAKFKTVGEMLGRQMDGEMQVTAYEPDSKCGFQMNAGPVQVNVTLTFKTVGTGTKLDLNAQGNPAGFFKLAENMVAGQVKSTMQANLSRLKSVLEKGA